MLTGEQLIQFQTEARILCKLNHPNIVSVLDFGWTGSKAPYMVLEYFDAVTLQECELECSHPARECILLEEAIRGCEADQREAV